MYTNFSIHKGEIIKMSKIGNRIFTKFERADKELVEAFRGIPSSNTNDEMNRLFCMNENMRLINPKPGKSMVGTAFTVKAPIGDNLYLHYALDMAQPGDIIVVDGGGYANRSFCGEIMMRFAQKKGLAGVVIDRFGQDIIMVPKEDGAFTTHVLVSVSPQFYGWIAGLGGQVRILGPDSVRDGFRDYLDRLREQY